MIQNLPGSTEFDVDAAIITTFDLAYIKSKSDPVQALWAGSYELPGQPLVGKARVDLARTLYSQGFTLLDLSIDVFGTDPYLTMVARKSEGWTSIGSWQPQMSSPIAGTLKVSTDPNDFPPFDPPPSPKPIDTSFVGAFAYVDTDGSRMFYVTMYALKAGVVNGMLHTEGPAQYQFVTKVFMIGSTSFWRQL